MYARDDSAGTRWEAKGGPSSADSPSAPVMELAALMGKDAAGNEAVTVARLFPVRHWRFQENKPNGCACTSFAHDAFFRSVA